MIASKMKMLADKAVETKKNEEEKELKKQELTQKKDMYSLNIKYSGSNKELFKIMRGYLYHNSFHLKKSSRKSGLYQGELLYRQICSLFKGSINRKSMTLIFLECFKIQEYNIEFDLTTFEDKLKRISNFNLLKYGAVN